jgi:hypothetical protein
MAVIWHYTIGKHMKSILADGVIKPATAGVARGQRPIVWFSANALWEQTANKMLEQGGKIILLNQEQTEKAGDGLYRIAVSLETAPHNWERLVFLSKMPPAEARSLEKVAADKGANHGEWFGTVHPVDRTKWVSVEKLVCGTWTPIESLNTVAKGY